MCCKPKTIIELNGCSVSGMAIFLCSGSGNCYIKDYAALTKKVSLNNASKSPFPKTMTPSLAVGSNAMITLFLPFDRLKDRCCLTWLNGFSVQNFYLLN